MENNFNRITVPMYEFDRMGNIKPNLLFHRPWDKLHSRCIEYPFAASQIGRAQCILDTGTTKSDPIWIKWLESLSIKVYATDYDEPTKPFYNIIFHQADIRKLPFEDSTFDKVLAISVIEHIGLENPQVLAKEPPRYSTEGDLFYMGTIYGNRGYNFHQEVWPSICSCSSKKKLSRFLR